MIPIETGFHGGDFRMSDRRAPSSGVGRQRRSAFAAILGAADAQDQAQQAGPSSRAQGGSTATRKRKQITTVPSHKVRSVSSLVLNSQSAPIKQHYEERVVGKFVQLANLDRARPKPLKDSLANEQLRNRDKRLIKQDARNCNRLLKTGLAVETRKARRAARQQQKREEGRPLSRRQRKLMGLEHVDRGVSFESLLSIYSLWLAYVHRLLGLHPSAQPQNQGKQGKGQAPNDQSQHGVLSYAKSANGEMQAVLAPSHAAMIAGTIVKADMCGAPIRVVQSLNPALVGIEGLVASETESTFVIVPRPPPKTAQSPPHTARFSPLKTVPKRNSIFVLQIVLPEQASAQSNSAASLAHSQPFGSTSYVPGQAAISPYPSKAGTAAMTSPPLPSTTDPVHAIEIPIHGNQLCNSLPTRATRKYKARKTTELGV